MPLPQSFQTFAEFEREIIRPGSRVGFSLDDLVEDLSFDGDLQAEPDPFDALDEG